MLHLPQAGVKLKQELKSYVRQFVEASEGRLTLFEHRTAMDITPGGVDKGMATRALMKIFGLSRDSVSAVGDGTNDIPLFSAVGFSIIIGYQVDYPGAHHCNDIHDALQILEYNSGKKEVALPCPFPETLMGVPHRSRRSQVEGNIAL